MISIFRIKGIVKLGIKSILMHRLRSFLTVLGIIFGVSSVVAMLAIGEGAKRESQKQIEQLGSKNIIVKTVQPPESPSASGKSSSMKEYGLTYQDLERLMDTLPHAQVIVPLRRFNQSAFFSNKKIGIEVIGTAPWYAESTGIELKQGRFLCKIDMDFQKSVCVIDEEVSSALFGSNNPLGEEVKIASNYYTVVGIVGTKEKTKTSETELSDAVSKDTSSAVTGTIFIPLDTVKGRFGELNIQVSSGSRQIEKVQLQEITVKVKNLDDVLGTRDIIEGMLSRFHTKKDYQIVVPLELLRQAMRTKRMFSIVLGSIAAISLLVGGIGIMNIMLATVSERTREIGIRRALGAKKKDIIIQFLSETVLLSSIGGILGILIGIGVPKCVTLILSMPTVVTGFSLILSFGISGLVGITFGLYPAWRAAMMDPIESLRHE
jgi:putative ABC transport system permease protein